MRRVVIVALVVTSLGAAPGTALNDSLPAISERAESAYYGYPAPLRVVGDPRDSATVKPSSPSETRDSRAEKVLGAFLGAFFAFCFFRVGQYLNDRFERYRKHYNSLNRLQHLLNDYLGLISDNVYMIEKFEKVIENAHASWSFPRALPIDRSFYDDTYNLALINALRDLNQKLININHDLENTRTGYEDIRRIFLEGGMVPPTYKGNASEFVKGFKVLARAQEELLEDVQRLLAWVRRVSLRDRSWGTKLLFLGLRSHDISEPEITAELGVLKGEMEGVRAKSRKYIDKILGREPEPTSEGQ